jgi:hypothetical protein
MLITQIKPLKIYKIGLIIFINMKRKQIIVLPTKFQETVILKEIEHKEKKDDIELLKQLLYLYSVYIILIRDRYGVL